MIKFGVFFCFFVGLWGFFFSQAFHPTQFCKIFPHHFYNCIIFCLFFWFFILVNILCAFKKKKRFWSYTFGFCVCDFGFVHFLFCVGDFEFVHYFVCVIWWNYCMISYWHSTWILICIWYVIWTLCYYVLLNFFFCTRLIEGLWKFMIYGRIELSNV